MADGLQGDTSGSVEAIKASLNTLPQDKVVLRFLMAAAGEINVSDVDLADASEGIVFGFNCTIPESVLAYAERVSAIWSSRRTPSQLQSMFRTTYL